MNCTEILSCFNNQTNIIVEGLVERVAVMYINPGNIKFVRLLAPGFIGIGVLDHIRRAISLSEDGIIPSSEVLGWKKFKAPIIRTVIYSLSDLPNFFNWFDTTPTLLKVGKQVADNIICPSSYDVLQKLKTYSGTLNSHSNYFGSFFTNLIGISVILMVTIFLRQVDKQVNGLQPLFKTHRINYKITYGSIAALFLFQFYLFYLYDLRYSAVDLQNVLYKCGDDKAALKI